MTGGLTMLQENLIFSRKRDKIQAEYNKFYSPYVRINFARGVILFFILMFAIGVIINSPKNGSTFQLIGFMLIIFLLLSNRLQIRYRVKKNQLRIDELKKEYQELSLLIKNTGLAEQYSYTYAIEKLINYLSVGRADNLKEALNLFELELRHDEQLNKLREINLQQQKQLQELQSIKGIVRF